MAGASAPLRVACRPRGVRCRPPRRRVEVPPAGGHRVLREGAGRPDDPRAARRVHVDHRRARSAGGRRPQRRGLRPARPVPVRIYTPGRRRRRPALPGLAARRRVPDGRPRHARGRLDGAADLRAGRRRRRQRRLPAVRRRRDLPGAARRRRRRRPLGARQRRRRSASTPTGSRSAAPAPAATSPPAPRCASGTTTAGCRPRCARVHDVPRRRPAAVGRRWRRCWTRSPGCSASCPRTAGASPRTTSAARRAAPTATRCRATPSSRASAPVLLLNSEYDDLRASAEVFAGQLAAAGVDVRQVARPGHAARLPEPARRRRAGRPTRCG